MQEADAEQRGDESAVLPRVPAEEMRSILLEIQAQHRPADVREPLDATAKCPSLLLVQHDPRSRNSLVNLVLRS